MEPMEPMEPTEPIEPMAPTEPMEPMEPMKAMEPIITAPMSSELFLDEKIGFLLKVVRICVF